MLKHYLSLQFKLLNRNIRDFGMNPLLAYVLIFGLIAGLGTLVFQKMSDYAPYIIIGVCVLLQMRLSQKQRSDFLHIVYSYKTKRLLRMTENLIISIPFVTLLLIENQYIAALGLLEQAYFWHLLISIQKALYCQRHFPKVHTNLLSDSENHFYLY